LILSPFSAPSRGHGELGKRSCAPGGTAGFCFGCAALRVYGSSKNREVVILGTSSKSIPWPREQGPTRLWVPRETGQKKEKTKMTNEIRTDEAQGRGKAIVSWAALLSEAVSKPGYIHEAYSRFHNYSLGNQLLALFQCGQRGIQPGPLATFPKWKELGRSVKKGERALMLCMPITCKRTKEAIAADGTAQEETFAFTHFTYKAHWFVLAQTEGAEYVAPALPDWNEQTALQALNIERIEFEALDGNVQGYSAPGRKLAVSPVAALPQKTLFHELAHIVLGHCDAAGFSELEITPRDIREVEAESVALLCCESLELPGAEFSRGYIQEWGRGQAITERSAQRIFHAANQILRAGRTSGGAR
jgi:N-terminal domain of anti-restriction factor ArdC